MTSIFKVKCHGDSYVAECLSEIDQSPKVGWLFRWREPGVMWIANYWAILIAVMDADLVETIDGQMTPYRGRVRLTRKGREKLAEWKLKWICG